MTIGRHLMARQAQRLFLGGVFGHLPGRVLPGTLLCQSGTWQHLESQDEDHHIAGALRR